MLLNYEKNYKTTTREQSRSHKVSGVLCWSVIFPHGKVDHPNAAEKQALHYHKIYLYSAFHSRGITYHFMRLAAVLYQSRWCNY